MPLLVRGLLFTFLFLPLVASAQLVTVSGTIKEKASGEVVIGATVTLQPDSAREIKRQRGGSTNKFGFYSIPNIAPGKYLLAVRAIGYKRESRSITITSETGRLNFDLEREDIRGTDVTVEADKDAADTRSISSIDISPTLIEQLPSLGGEQDLFRALQLLPGVKAASEISSGLYVRGGSPDQNLTLLDGVIVYNPSHLGGFLSTFNTDALQDIRLIKGAFPAEYGGRLSSVLDVTMKEGTKEKFSGSGALGLITSRLTLEGPITDKSTFMLSGRRMYLDAVVALAGAPPETPTYYFYDFKGKTNYIISDNDRIYLSGYKGRDVFGIPFTEKDSIHSAISWGNATANLRWTHIFSPELFSNFSAIYTQYDFDALIEDRNYNGGDNFKSVNLIQDIMLRGELQYFPTQDHTIKAGLEATNHRFNSGATVNVEEFGEITLNPTILRSMDVSVYAQDEWKWGAHLSGNFGGRLYWFERGNYFRAEPRLALSYAFNEDIKLKAAFSTGNQFLHLITRNDIALPTDVWFPSTETIRPGEAVQSVLGLETFLFDKTYVLTVEGYYKSMKNLYEYKDTAQLSLGVPLESSFTRGTGEAYGLELFINKRIGSFTGWIGYTLAATRRTFPDLNNGKPFFPRYDRTHDVSLVLAYRLGEAWEFGMSWVYGTGQAYTVPSGHYYMPNEDIDDPDATYYPEHRESLNYTERNGYRIPAFHKLDVNFTHNFSMFGLPWKFHINVYNAYNHKNVFAQSVEADSEYDPANNESKRVYRVHRYTLFPIIPTFALSFKF